MGSPFRRLAGVLAFFTMTGVMLAAPAVRPGYLVGAAKNSAGAPLAGVKIRLFGTTDAGHRSSLNTRTKPDGTFAQRLPAGQYSLREANWPVTRDGRAYSLPLYLEGENNDDFDATEGATVELTLRMSGKISAAKSDTDEGAWFGGTVELEYINSDGSPASALPENAKLEINLVPRGRLFDGSPAKPVRLLRDLAWQRPNRILLDVPLADYEATVSLTAEGRTIPLLVSSREAISSAQATELGAKAPVRFAPRSGDPTLLSSNGVVKCVLQLVIPRPGATIAAATSWNVGDAVNVLRSPLLGQWHTGRILQVKDGQYLIKYDEFGADQNEWVDASRIKQR